MGKYRIISSDNHVAEPPDLWTSRMEPQFKDRAPYVVRDKDADWWCCDDLLVAGLGGAGGQVGTRFEEPEKLSRLDVLENLPPAGYIPGEHIKAMDADGIDVSVLYPTIALLLYNVPDIQLLTSICRTYNDWVGEFCKPFPNRLKGISMLNADDVGVAVKELERSVKLGFPGAMISVYPHESRSYDSPEYDPLWAAAQDLEIPLSLHIGTNRPGPGQVDSAHSKHARSAPYFINADYWVRMSFSHMIFSGVFERYPKLRVGAVEHELSWVPHFLERMDYNYTQRAREIAPYRFKGDALPSDFFHRNIFVSFQEDAFGIRVREVIGVDKLMWGSDFPHPESTFPRSQQIIEKILADCTEEEKAKLLGENAARVYGF